MKIIVSGDRSFEDYKLLSEKLDSLFSQIGKDKVEIVSGGNNGADKLGEKYAKENEMELTIFPANWQVFQYRAGFIRNKEMINYADGLVLFGGLDNKETKHLYNMANDLQLKVKVIEIKKPEKGFGGR